MHKAVILIMQAESRKDAKTTTDKFMDDFKNDVWDWWVIGGRWSRTLNSHKVEFDKQAQEMCLTAQIKQRGEEHKDDLCQSTIDEMQGDLNTLWKR